MALQTTTRTLGAVLGMLGRLAAFTFHVTKQSWPSGKLWPLLILGVLGLGRWWAMNTGTLLVFGVSLLGAVCVAGYLSRKLTHPTDWGYALACLIAGTTGLVLVSIVDTPPWLNILSVLGWAGLSLPWWLHGQRMEAPAPPPIVPTDPEVVANWNRYIRDTHDILGGASISPPLAFDHGNEYIIDVVPGKQHLGTFEGNMRNISTALDVPLHKLLLEQHPDYPNSSRKLRFRHVTRSPIENAVYFTEPKVEDGRIVLGPYADGMGHASWRLFTENSMWNGFILGDVGSGKTRLLELIALVARSMGVFLIYIDGQNGASSPTLWKYATWRGGPDQAETILAALERGKDKRQIYNRVHEQSGFTHSEEMPGILTIIDECHRVFDPNTADRWADLSREERKVGGGIIGASQGSGVQTFGGHEVLRSCLFAGNSVALRTSSRLSAQLIPGLEVDPALFPKLPGYGYYVDASGELRTAPFRCEWLPDVNDKERNPDIPVPTVEEWFDQLPEPELDDMTAAAFGEPFLNRHELAAKRDDADRAWLEGREEETPAVAEVPALEVGSPVPAFTEPLTEALHIGTAAAIEDLFTSQEQMTLKDIIDGLSRSGRYPTVFTVRAALNHLADNQRVTRAGDTYRKGEAA
jgi:hypothetical protein